MSASLGRRALAEAVGSAALVAVVVGSGIQATGLSRDVGVQLLANSLATVFGLGVLIVLLGPVSGAHFNPVVTLAAWLTDRRAGDGFKARDVAAYVPAQIVGATAGAVVADAITVNPAVVEAMSEADIGISAETPKILTVEAVQASDVVITMGCGDACPVFPGKTYLDGKSDDPAGQGVDGVRPIRGEIEGRVRALLTDLGVQPRA